MADSSRGEIPGTTQSPTTSKHELGVFALIAQGRSNQQIAERLNADPRLVHQHQARGKVILAWPSASGP
ncbi:LuxR C-terminal-related transcriptional regulator [Metapseudomonas lalkuanensis]|uniref:LuxR C-terminal-related transcriptional regulator n=1 Tax=Metapseudomonas lalkuanensis TaxID=2604832 RepID=UPI00384F7B09